MNNKYLNKDLAIVIPAFNEEKTIESILTKANLYGFTIVIDDASIDNTIKIANSNSGYLIKNSNNIGYNNSINKGINKAINLGFKYIITIDADGELPVNKIPKFIEKLENGYDLVIGNRNKKNRYVESLFSFLSKKTYGINDPLCGMKGYSSKKISNLKMKSSYDSIGTEIAFRLANEKIKFINININVKRRLGNSRFGCSLKSNLMIIYAMIMSILIKF